MNELAIRLEEQIISLFPDKETQVSHGWILKKMRRQFWIYPLYYNLSWGNIPDLIQNCEEISHQSGMDCMFRIVEHTNYYLSAILKDTGYAMRKCGVVGEMRLADFKTCLGEKKEPSNRLFLRKEASEETVEYVMADIDEMVGIKRQSLLFLPVETLSGSVTLRDVMQFSWANGITKILVDISEREDLPEQYKQVGFHRAYLYRCYQK